MVARTGFVASACLIETVLARRRQREFEANAIAHGTAEESLDAPVHDGQDLSNSSSPQQSDRSEGTEAVVPGARRCSESKK